MDAARGERGAGVNGQLGSAGSRTTAAPGRPGMLPSVVASAAMFLVNMDTLITNVALPAIQSELGGGMAALQWVVDGYTLAFAALLLLAGTLADRFGARRAFALGIAAFGTASLLCSLAPTVGVLVAGRALLGAVAAFVLPSSMTLINEAYPVGRDRMRALAVWGVGGSTASAAGPLVGGLLAPVRWSLVFAVNVPVCLGILACVPRLARSARVARPFDVPGQVLGMLGLAGLVGGIIETGERDPVAPAPLALLASGVVLLVAFALVQARSAHPMLPPSIFRPAGMRLALFGGFAMILSWNGCVFLCALFLQQGLGMSALASGLAFVPAALTTTAGNLVAGRAGGRRGSKVMLVAGIALIAAGYGVFVVFAGSLNAPLVTLAVCVSGAGGGMVTPTLANLVLASVPAEQAGVGSAAFNTLRQVGGALGIALFGTLAAGAPTFAAGFVACFLITLALLAGMLALAARLEV